MAKLRKMLGDIDSVQCRELMRLIATQSHKTLDAWAVEYAAEKCLPIYEAERPGETLLRETVDRCREYIAGGMMLKELKPFLADARKFASAVKGDTAQAAARAVATACAVVQTPTNAFGFLMYSAAAAAYHELGLDRDASEYEAFAVREMQHALDSLAAVAVENEKDPVKIDWNC